MCQHCGSRHGVYSPVSHLRKLKPEMQFPFSIMFLWIVNLCSAISTQCLLVVLLQGLSSVKLRANCSKSEVEGEGFALSKRSLESAAPWTHTRSLLARVEEFSFGKPPWQEAGFAKSPGLSLSPSLSMTQECLPVTIPMCICSKEKKKISLLKTNGEVF